MLFQLWESVYAAYSYTKKKKKKNHVFTHLRMEQQHFPVNTLYILLNRATLSVLQKLLFCDPCIQFKENRIKSD